MTDNQLPPLPTLQPGDSQMESLIEAAIQGHADTREAMRWLVRQLVPATQPAEVTDADIVAVMRDGNNCNYNDEAEHIQFARAILALRTAAVPMSDEYVQAACGDIFASDHTEPGAYDLAIWRKAETAHGITAQAKKEDK